MCKLVSVWLTAAILVIGSTMAMADRNGPHSDRRHGHKHHDHQRWQPPGQRAIHIHKQYRKDYPGYLGAALPG